MKKKKQFFVFKYKLSLHKYDGAQGPTAQYSLHGGSVSAQHVLLINVSYSWVGTVMEVWLV